MSSASKKTRIVIIGAGAVGSTTAYTLLLRERMDELVLIDVNKEKAFGDALDMNHGLPFLGKARIWAGSFEDCAEADIIIITAGVSQRPGESRIDLLKRNVAIYEGITDEVLKHNSNGILLIASNPVDIMSYFTWKNLAGLFIVSSGQALCLTVPAFVISSAINSELIPAVFTDILLVNMVIRNFHYGVLPILPDQKFY